MMSRTHPSHRTSTFRAAPRRKPAAVAGGAAVIALVAALTGTAVLPAEAAPVAGTLTAPAGPIIHGEKVTLTGSLPPAKARSVRLERLDSTGWIAIATKKSTNTGTFTFTTPAPLPPESEVIYRVFADAAVISKVSYPEVETPSVTLALTAQSSSLHVPQRGLLNATASVNAAFFPARLGRTVNLQRQNGTQWKNVAQGTQDPNGVVSFTWTATPAGLHNFRATTAAANGSAAHSTLEREILVVTSGDTTPPAVPGPATANGSVRLDWPDPAAADDVIGYNVYRGTTQYGPWFVTASPVPASLYTDPVPDFTRYWYAVSAIDRAGNESGLGAGVKSDGSGGTSPARPTGLAAEPSDGQVVLTWDAVTDPDLAGYRVYRGANGNIMTVLPVGILTATTYTDTSVSNGTGYTYAVTAIATDGNESQLPPMVSAVPVR